MKLYSPKPFSIPGVDTLPIAAVVAAAGFSRRMGKFKQLLPWGESTVIRSVVDNLAAGGAQPVLCVTGHRAEEVAAALNGSPARIVHNLDYAGAEMLTSYQAGIRALDPARCLGSLLALADQPHLPVAVIRQVVEQARQTPEQVVIPSHQMRRGHPIYLPAVRWPDLLSLPKTSSLRDLLTRWEEEIVYVTVDTDAIRRDMDEWGEYERLREEFEGEDS